MSLFETSLVFDLLLMNLLLSIFGLEYLFKVMSHNSIKVSENNKINGRNWPSNIETWTLDKLDDRQQ